jgi:hypothetical protein
MEDFMRAYITVSTLTIFVFLLAACGGQATSTPTATENFGEIIDEKIYTNDIPTVRVFDQCQSAGSFSADIAFNNSVSNSSSTELQLGLVSGGEIGSPVIRAKLEAEVRSTFANEVTTNQGSTQAVHIEVPGGEKQESTIVWREKRVKGTINFTDNGRKDVAIYDYRIGWELVSSSAKDLGCANGIAPSPTPSSTMNTNLLLSEDFQDGQSSLAALVGNYSIVDDISQNGNKVLEFNTDGSTDVSSVTLLSAMPTDYSASYRTRFTRANLQDRDFVSFSWKEDWVYVIFPSQGHIYTRDRVTQNTFFEKEFVYQTNKWYTLKIDVIGDEAHFYLNGTEVGSFNQVKPEVSPNGLYMVIGEGSGIVQFDDITVSVP